MEITPCLKALQQFKTEESKHFSAKKNHFGIVRSKTWNRSVSFHQIHEILLAIKAEHGNDQDGYDNDEEHAHTN